MFTQEVNFSNKIQRESELVKYLFIKYYLWLTHAMPNSKFKEMDNRGGIVANVVNKTLVSNTLGVIGSAALTAATGGALLPLFVGSAITSVVNVTAPTIIDKVTNRAKVGIEKQSDDNMDPIKVVFALGVENLDLFFREYYEEQYSYIMDEFKKIKEPKIIPNDAIDMFIKCIYILDKLGDDLISKNTLKTNLTEFIKTATVENDQNEFVPCIDLYDTVNPVEELLNNGTLDQDSFNLYVQYIDFVINQYYFEENERIKRLPLFSKERVKSFFLSIFYEKSRSRFVKKNNARGFFGNIGISTLSSTAVGSVLDNFLFGIFGTIVNKFASSTAGLLSSNSAISIYQEKRFRKRNSYPNQILMKKTDFEIIQLSRKNAEFINNLYKEHGITMKDNSNRVSFLQKVRFAVSRGNFYALASKEGRSALANEITSRRLYHFCLDKMFMNVRQMEEAEMLEKSLKTGNTKTNFMSFFMDINGNFEDSAILTIMQAKINKTFLGQETDDSVVASVGFVPEPVALNEREKLSFKGKKVYKFKITSLMNDGLILFNAPLTIGDCIYVEADSPVEAMFNANLGKNIIGCHEKKSGFVYISNYLRSISAEPKIYVRNAKGNYIDANTMTPEKITCKWGKETKEEDGKAEIKDETDKNVDKKTKDEQNETNTQQNMPNLESSKKLTEKRTKAKENNKDTPKKEHRTRAAQKQDDENSLPKDKNEESKNTTTTPEQDGISTKKSLPETTSQKINNEEINKKEESLVKSTQEITEKSRVDRGTDPIFHNHN